MTLRQSIGNDAGIWSNSFRLPKASRMAILAGAFFLASLPALANSVSFDGYAFSSFYGPENLTFDGSGNLLVPTVLSNFGAAATLFPTGASSVTTSFLDSGITSGPAAELWVQDFANSFLYEAAVGAFTGLSDFYFMYRIDGGSVSVFQDSGIARTKGIHSASIALLSDGTLEFLLDNTLVGSASTAQYGIPQLSNALLTANGDALLEQATFTSFSAAPEPSYLACWIGIFVALGFVLRRNQVVTRPGVWRTRA